MTTPDPALMVLAGEGPFARIIRNNARISVKVATRLAQEQAARKEPPNVR
jgi:hypothetical protein